MGLVDSLILQFQAQQERANAANELRYQQGLDLFDRIIAQSEGGGFMAATEAGLERGQTKAVSQGMQSLVSSGLSSTTQAAGLGKKYEEEVGAPARLQAADVEQQRLTQALTGKAGFIERREDIGPDFATIAGLAQSIGAGQQAQYTPTPSYSQPTPQQATVSQSAPRYSQLAPAPAPRVYNAAAAAQEKRSYAAQAYAKLTSQRQQAGNVARAAAGL